MPLDEPFKDYVALLLRWKKRARESQFAHYTAANSFGRRGYCLGIPSAILATIVGSVVFASIGENPSKWAQVTVGLLSLLSAILISLQTYLNLDGLTEHHNTLGKEYGSVRRKIEAMTTEGAPPSMLKISMRFVNA